MFCNQCGQQLAPVSRFCHNCSAPVIGADGLVTAEFVRPSQERKQVTILFADLVDSTSLVQDLTPDELDEWFAGILSAMSRAVHRHGGTVNKSQGDGIMAVFGAPVAYEDHAIRACNAAWDLVQTKLHADDFATKVRVGLHSGDVMLRTVQSDFSTTYEAIGYNVHLASRMENIAPEGGVVMTEVTAQLARGYIETEFMGPTTIRGAREALNVYRLTGISTGKSRWEVRAAGGLSPFKGRQGELRILSDRLRDCTDRPQVLAFSGDPGVGKSRLIHEFISTKLPAEWQVFRINTVSHGGKITYYPISRFLRSWLQIEPIDSHAEIRTKLHARNIYANDSSAEISSSLCSLLDLPVDDPDWEEVGPKERHQRIIRTVRAMIEQAVTDRPTVLVIEDLHWIDPGTQSIFESVVTKPPAKNLFILATYRPEYKPDWEDWGHLTNLTLDPLSTTDSRDLLVHSFGELSDIDQNILDRLIERSGGTPLFLEEIARTIREWKDAGGAVSTAQLETQIPSSVQSILAARIDRLELAAKQAMQIAAVIGREFQLSQLVQIAGGSLASVGDDVAELEARGLIGPLDSDLSGAYCFSHALIRDAAYQSLPLRDSKALHSRALEFMSRGEPERQDEQVEIMAHHAIQGENWDQAVRLLERSAVKALARSANTEAASFLEQAIQALDKLPHSDDNKRQAVDLRLQLRVAYFPLGKVTEIGKRLAEAIKVADEIGDRERVARVSLARLITFHVTGDLTGALKDGDRARDIASDLDDQGLLMGASLATAQVRNFASTPNEVIDLLEPYRETLLSKYRHARIGGSTASSVNCLACLGTAYALSGSFAAAKECTSLAIEIAVETNRDSDAALAHYIDGLVENHRGEPVAALATLEQGMAACTNSETQILQSWMMVQMGFAYLIHQEYETAAEILSQAKMVMDKMGVKTHGSTLRVYLAEAFVFTERLDEAKELAEEAWQWVQIHKIKIMEARCLWLQGILALRLPSRNMNSPISYFEHGIDVAERRQQPMDMGNCLYGIALCLQRQGKQSEAETYIARAQAVADEYGGALTRVPSDN